MSLRSEAMQIVKDFLGMSNKVSLIADIPLEVISEKTRSLSVSVPTKRVESGFNISDTVRKDPIIMHITVVDNSRDYMLNRQSLEKLQETGELVTFYFSGRDTYDNMILESIEELETEKQKYGFTYYIVLRQIQMAEIKESDVKLDSKKAKTTGGKKKITSAKSSNPTKAELGKAQSTQQERGKSAIKQMGSNF